MSNVYKGLGRTNEKDKVKIPESKDKIIKEPEFDAVEKSEITDEIENKEADGDAANDQFSEKQVSVEIPEPEPEPEPIPLSLEEVKDIYEEQLRTLADDVAKQAYYDALNEKKAELRKVIADVQNVMDQLVMNHANFIEEYTDELKYMALEIAQKLIVEKIDEDELILERLVMQTVSSIKNAEWLNVELSERLVNLVDSIKRELDKPDYNGRAHVFPVAGTNDICRVTSEDGTIVSTISVQAENLKKVFREIDQQ